MTTPDLHVNTDEERGFGSRTHARVADFHYEPADADGSWPSQQSTRRFHGTVHATGQQLGDNLDAVAGHSEQSASAHDKQEGMNSGAMKDLAAMGTGALKDVMGLATNVAQVGTQMATTLGQGVTQAGTAAKTAAMTAATTAAKAPGGTPTPLPSAAEPPDSPTTTGHHHDGKGHPRADADANT